jgi:excisionase family DNA binding protein
MNRKISSGPSEALPGRLKTLDLQMGGRLLLRIPEVAEALGVGITKAWELVRTGELKSCRLGRCRRVTKESLEEYVRHLEEASK